jgi:3-isopropylmalate/(R)-2-methylmalate dehydratase small subunit
MEKVTRITGIAAPLMLDDIDTDALAPTQMLHSAEVDFGHVLLGMWRYADKAGAAERPDFVLNREPYRRARILLAGVNFGCGSSREHAVWALMGFGIKSVIAASFSDIFYDNACKNGLLAVTLPRPAIDAIAAEVEAGRGGREMTVDLEACAITTPAGGTIAFSIDPGRRTALLEGLDEIGLTLKASETIAGFQQRDRAARPWIYDADFHAGAEAP